MPFSRFARADLVASMTVAYLSVISPWRSLTACQRPSSTMRRSGTSVTIHSSGGLIRETLLPVYGFLT